MANTSSRTLKLLSLLQTHRFWPGPELAHRLEVSERTLRRDPQSGTPVLLFGAGAAGHTLVRSMLHDPRGRYLPVGIIDDDPAKRHLRAHRVPVLGNRHDIPEALAATGATTRSWNARQAA